MESRISPTTPLCQPICSRFSRNLLSRWIWTVTMNSKESRVSGAPRPVQHSQGLPHPGRSEERPRPFDRLKLHSLGRLPRIDHGVTLRLPPGLRQERRPHPFVKAEIKLSNRPSSCASPARRRRLRCKPTAGSTSSRMVRSGQRSSTSRRCRSRIRSSGSPRPPP